MYVQQADANVHVVLTNARGRLIYLQSASHSTTPSGSRSTPRATSSSRPARVAPVGWLRRMRSPARRRTSWAPRSLRSSGARRPRRWARTWRWSSPRRYCWGGGSKGRGELLGEKVRVYIMHLTKTLIIFLSRDAANKNVWLASVCATDTPQCECGVGGMS